MSCNLNKPKKFILLIAFILLLLPCKAMCASQYTPPGLYNPDFIKLDNGLTIILKQRDVSHTASMRLAVDVGAIDFPCGKKELPHYLEHLLFTGTSKHTESELDAIIEENGGSWNGATGDEQTAYGIDIYSPNVLLALDILFEIMTDSQMLPEKVSITKDIIHREMGGRPSSLRQWLYSKGIGRYAHTNALLGVMSEINLECESLQTADNISRDEIIDAYKKYYVPNNMILIVVGEFDKPKLINFIENTFGRMEKGVFTTKRNPPKNNYVGPSVFSGSFAPIVDSEASVAIAFRTKGELSHDWHALRVIEEYLDKRLYEVLRIEKGLSYSPSSSQSEISRVGYIYLYADIDIDKVDNSLSLIQDEIEILKKGKFNPKEIENAKKRLLLSWVQGYESNSDIADYYQSTTDEFKEFGWLIDHEEKVELIDVDAIRSVVPKYFNDTNKFITINKPTLTYTQFFICILILIIMLAFGGWMVVKHFRKKHLK